MLLRLGGCRYRDAPRRRDDRNRRQSGRPRRDDATWRAPPRARCCTSCRPPAMSRSATAASASSRPTRCARRWRIEPRSAVFGKSPSGKKEFGLECFCRKPRSPAGAGSHARGKAGWRNARTLDGNREGSKIWKTPDVENKLFSPPNPLKKLKTTKEMFAKIWRKQAKICKNWPKSLVGLPRREAVARSAPGCPV